MAIKRPSTERLVLSAILASIALIAIFAIAKILTDNQAIILFALTILALLFYLMTRRWR